MTARVRAHGTRARYVFGPQGGDRSQGCRCEPCSEANRAYARMRDRASRRPDEKLEPAYVDARPAREHLEWLSSQGVGRRTVAARSGVALTSIQRIRQGSLRRARPATIDAILAVGRSAARGAALVDAKQTWRLLDDLIAHGHTRTSIARALGSTARTPSLQLGREQVTAANARKVAELHARLMFRVVRRREIARDERRRYRDAA